MRANSRAIQSYGDVKVSSGVATANNVQLIQMLFDGLLESLSTARGHIQHKISMKIQSHCTCQPHRDWPARCLGF